MRRKLSDYDESDVRIRPSRRGSRPRTKRRPRHEDAVTGRVVRVDRGRYGCLVNGVDVTAMKARELGRHAVVVGDEVALVGDVSGAEGTLARIVRVQPRSTVLRRTADDTDPVERIIVANVDLMVVVTSLTDPEPRPRLIDRCLVAAYDAGIHPVLVVTKTDLADPGDFLAAFEPLDLEVLTCGQAPGASDDEVGDLDPEAVAAIARRLAGHSSVLVGHSGVGKSTLVNALVPGLGRAVGHVNEVTGRGRHTSTSAVAAPLPPLDYDGSDDNGPDDSGSGDADQTVEETGWVVDTPGIRSFGLAHVKVDTIVEHFPELAAGTAECPRGCTHDEPECALDALVANTPAEQRNTLRLRLDSLRRLLRARRGESDDGGDSPQTDA